jgi:hypothetical protein
MLLRPVVRHSKRVDVDERRRSADHETTDLFGGAEIALEQRRRQLEHAADVVEPVARVVARKQRGNVDVDRE